MHRSIEDDGPASNIPLIKRRASVHVLTANPEWVVGGCHESNLLKLFQLKCKYQPIPLYLLWIKHKIEVFHKGWILKRVAQNLKAPHDHF